MHKFFIFFVVCCSVVFCEITPFSECLGLVRTKNRGLLRKMTSSLEKAYELNHFENVTPSQTPRIPKLIHMIWLGSPLPERFEIFVNSWKEHHPDWTFKLWTDKDIDSIPLVTGKAIQKVKNWGQKSDILRLEILNLYGGMYVDTDFFCIKPLDILHHTCDFYTGMGSRIILTGIIGTKPGHPIIRNFLHRINLKQKEGRLVGANIITTTGPEEFNYCVLKHLKKDITGCIAYPATYFYSFPLKVKNIYWKTRNPQIFLRYATDDSFATHVWAHSWVKKIKPIRTKKKPSQTKPTKAA